MATASPSEVTEVVVLARSRPPTLGRARLICVDGPAGSGKTTFGRELARELDAQLIGTDELMDGWRGLSAVATQLAALCAELAAGRPGSYERYDWHAGRYAERVPVAPAPWLVVEGVGSGAAALAAYPTVLVWVEAPDEVRLARGLARDGAGVEAEFRQFMLDERELFARERTRERADRIVATVVAPSGEQYEISGGGYRAVVTESGAALRLLEHEGRALVDGFGADETSSGGRGQVLIPWPNRIRDGRYDGQQLPLTEPARHNASHGLVRWAAFSLVEQAPDAVELGYRLVAQTGYPWTLDVRVRYAAGPGGLTVTQAATNRADSPAPFATGAHPYLSVGAGPCDGWELTLDAATRVLADPDRKLPTGTEPVAGTAYDFREGRPIGDLALDHAFTDLTWPVTLRGPEAAVELWADPAYGWVMVYTGDDNAEGTRRRSVAVEPMTAPADAFNSGDGLRRLAPGEAFEASWGIRAG